MSWRPKDATCYIYVYSLNLDCALALNSFALLQRIFRLLQKNARCLLYHRNKIPFFHKERENSKRDYCATIYSEKRSVIWLIKTLKLQPLFFSGRICWSPSGLLTPATISMHLWLLCCVFIKKLLILITKTGNIIYNNTDKKLHFRIRISKVVCLLLFCMQSMLFCFSILFASIDAMFTNF